MPVKYGIIEEWQTRIQVKQDENRLKQNSKKEAIQRMLISLGIDFIDFAAFKLGGCRYNPYNLIRLLVR